MRATGAVRIFALALAVSGCSSTADPCDGVMGICLTARVEGAVGGLDQLRVSLDTLPNMVVSPSTPSSFSLPVKLAVVFPSSAAGNANITIDGLSSGRVTASTGKVAIAIPASGHFAKTFTLSGPGGGDGGGPIDLAGGGGDGGNPDLAKPTSGVVLDQTSLVFPDTPRGTAQSMVLSFSFTNYNSTSTSLMNATTVGDMQSFKILPDPASPASCQMMMNPSAAAGASCRFNATFTPATSGKLSQTNTLMFSDGTTAMLTLTGTGLRAWTRESVPIGANLEAVWGSSPTDLYAVGHDAAGNGVYHSTGNGTWTSCALPAAILRNVFSITGDANKVMIGLDSGQIYQLGANCQWTSMSTANTGWPSSSIVRGLFLDANKVGWAVTDTGYVASSQPGSGTWNQVQNPGTTSTQLFGVNGFTNPNLATWVGAQANSGYGALVNPAGTFLTIRYGSAPLHSVWGTGSQAWAVGDNTSIWRVDYPSTMATLEPITTGASGGLTGVSGRIDPVTGKPDIYVVGFLGPQLLHSTGNGVWSSVTLPDNSGSSGVWVAPTGEVLVSQAVATSPIVLHYY